MRELALFSTYNKDGIVSLAKALETQGMEIVATGKTRSELEANGLKVLDISEVTGEPERFGGRVKTLHHKIMGGILFRPGQDEKEWPYDFRIAAVVCNFYPFAEKAALCDNLTDLSEWIDIGGPTMVRAAAKNCNHLWVFTKPEQYTRFIVSPNRDENLKARFALEAFEAVEELDASIAYHHQLMQLSSVDRSGGGELAYGENPHQKAHFLPNRKLSPKYYGQFSYNNVRDAEAALRFLIPFKSAAMSVVKHQTLCGAAVGLKGASQDDVFRWAWEGDPVSRFGGILAFNFLPSATATETLKKKFVELLVLPRSLESEKWAESFRAERERVKILLLDPNVFGQHHVHQVETESHVGLLGKIVQQVDSVDVVEADVSPQKLERAFGTWASSCSKSNAMVLCGFDESSRVAFLAGAGQGQPNRVDSLKLLAIPRAKEFADRMRVPFSSLVCFSDAFLPFDDCIHVLKDAGVLKLYQPGGSKQDEQVANTANQLGVTMLITHRRHFWH